MKESVSLVMSQLEQLQADNEFKSIFKDATASVTKLKLEPISLPRRRRQTRTI